MLKKGKLEEDFRVLLVVQNPSRKPLKNPGRRAVEELEGKGEERGITMASLFPNTETGVKKTRGGGYGKRERREGIEFLRKSKTIIHSSKKKRPRSALSKHQKDKRCAREIGSERNKFSSNSTRGWGALLRKGKGYSP